MRRDGPGGARAPFPLSSLLWLGIWVGKGWKGVLEYEIMGMGGRRPYYSTELGEGCGVPKCHTLGTKHRNHNISVVDGGLNSHTYATGLTMALCKYAYYYYNNYYYYVVVRILLTFFSPFIFQSIRCPALVFDLE